jgi:hypothetical protein
MLTRARLEQHLAQLVEERQKILDQLHAYDGALQFARGLLAEMEDDTAPTEAQ